jgi:hypothetical protein
VIVEDILSAVKTGRYMDSLALLGSYLPPTLQTIIDKYNKVFIWLDEDKYKTSINAMKKLTQLTGKPIIPIRTKLDPKECDTDVIERMLQVR